MKEYRLTIMVFIVLAVLMVASTGCKNEIAQPTVSNFIPTSPVITGVIPANGAPAGVNTITIQGQNFSDSLSEMVVYFNTTEAEAMSLSSSSITVRRPNMHALDASIKVVSSKSYKAISIGPYNVEQVFETFSTFLENIQLGAIAFNGDTLYTTEYLIPYTLYKVTPDGNKTALTLSGSARRTPYDLRAHNDTLFWMGNNREILRVNLKTLIASRWTQLPQGGPLSKFGDFGSNGYFYTGASSTDLCIVPPNPATSLTTVIKEGEYLAEEILAVRAFNNDIYVASRTVAGAPNRIYKHTIGTAGTLNSRTLVLDLATTSFSSVLVKAISFSNSGTLYITVDAPNPLLVYDGATLDFFYKGILSHTEGTTTAYWTGKQAYWGNQNYLYMIGSDTAAASTAQYKWNILKVNMGTAGAAYY